MKKIFSFSFLTAILTIALLSCKTNDGSDPDNPNNPDNPAVVMQNVALSGTVRDTNGNPMSGVRVTTGSLNITTGGDGTFSFKQAGTVDDRVIMKYEKSGYFTLTSSCDKDSDLYVEAMLYPQGNSDISLQTTFDASSAKTLQIGGMKIDFPASSITSADGKAYNGNVHVDALYLAPDNANFARLMPGGDLSCRLSDNTEKAIQLYGMTDVTLTDDAGKQLEIKTDAGVTISFPIPAAMSANAPATLSLWTFDDAKGEWLEEGTLILQDNAYKGTVTHFTKHAAGNPWTKIVLKVRVLECDKPVEGAEVWTPDDNLRSGYYSWTNSAGYCSITHIQTYTYAGLTKTVSATYNFKTKSVDIPASDGLQTVVINFDDDCPGVITFNLIPSNEKDQFIVQCVPAMPQPQNGIDRFSPDFFLIYNGLSSEGAFSWTTLGGSQDEKTGYYLGSHNFVSSACGWNKDFTEYTYTIISNAVTGAPDWIGTVYMNDVNTKLYNTETFSGDLKWLNIKSISIGNNTPVAMEAHGGSGE